MPRFGEAPGFTATDRTNLEAILTDTGTTLDTLIKDVFALSDTPYPKSYPAAAAGITLTSDSAAWTFGSWTEIVPANTITSDFWIIGLSANTGDSGYDYIIEIGQGAAGSESTKAQLRLARGSPVSLVIYPHLFRAIKVAANSRVAVRIATGEAAGNTLTSTALLYETGL